MPSEKGYQGWTNYETWAVKLWIDNEESSYRHWAEQARFVVSPKGRQSNKGRFSGVFDGDPDRLAVHVLAEQLKEAHEQQLPELSGFAADLLTSAFQEVNWTEIAEVLIDDALAEQKAEKAR